MKQNRTLLIQIALFVVTLITTTLTGAEFTFGSPFIFSSRPMGWHEFVQGFNYSIPFLGILTVHEFGHYFMARKHKTEVTLPYYIPFWAGGFAGLTTIGTLGAFIRIKERIQSRVKYFDIGIAGPLAGFVAALVVLWYGFTHLPSLDYVFDLFPIFKQYGMEYGKFLETAPGFSNIKLGDSLLFRFFQDYVAVGDLPHPYLYTNYPIIFAGYLSLFFTALNLFPIGQLDGGHILYGLIGDKAFNIVSPILFTLFVSYGGLGMFKAADFTHPTTDLYWQFPLYIGIIFLCFSRISGNIVTNGSIAIGVIAIQLIITYFYPTVEGYAGFLAFGVMIGRFLGIYHPPTHDKQPLTLERQILGWLALLIFILCFTPKPFTIIQNV